MGLDQYLFDSSIPNPFDPTDSGPELAYWRKDWNLQNYINSDNGENVNITLDYCNQLLADIPHIYADNDYYRDYSTETHKAFTEARKILKAGGRITYYGNW